MLGVVVRTARTVAVHNARVASDLSAEFPDLAIDTIRMGVPPIKPDAAAARLRQELKLPPHAVVFAAFGKVTAEKRIAPILRALGTLAAEGADVFLPRLVVRPADHVAARDVEVVLEQHRHGQRRRGGLAARRRTSRCA